MSETPIADGTTQRPERPERLSRRPRRLGRYVLPTYSWLVIAYLVFPIAVMVAYSFNRVTFGLQLVSFAWNGFTLQWYRQWSNVPGLTLLAIALVRYRRRKFRGKGTIEQILFLNIAAPEIVIGASLLGLFVTFNLARGFLTLVLAHVAFSIAYVTVTVRARLAGFDRSLEEAAYDLGANPLSTFRRVTLPLIMPGVLAGALMALALSIDDFVTSNFVSGSSVPFPVWVYGASRVGTPPQVFVFGTVIFMVGIAFALLSLGISRKKS